MLRNISPWKPYIGLLEREVFSTVTVTDEGICKAYSRALVS